MRKTFLAFVVIGILLVGTQGCDGIQTEPSAIRNTAQVTEYDVSVAITVGNHSYVPLNIDGDANEHTTEILRVLEKFEAQHLELEVTSWSLLRRQWAYGISARVYGIWVDHKPKNAQSCATTILATPGTPPATRLAPPVFYFSRSLNLSPPPFSHSHE